MQLHHFQVRLKIHLIIQISPNPVFLARTILTHQHENRKKNRLQRNDHCQQVIRKRIQRLFAEHVAARFCGQLNCPSYSSQISVQFRSPFSSDDDV